MLLVGASVCVVSASLEAQTTHLTGKWNTAIGSAVEAADALVMTGAPEAAYRLLEQSLTTDPDDFGACWRAARIAVALSLTGKTHTIRRAWSIKADTLGRRLLRMRPTDTTALAWAAAGRGRHAMNEEGLRTPAQLAKETWELTEKLLAIDPGNALGNDVQGTILREVAGLNGATRLFARLFVGSALVSRATWANAEAAYRRALERDPGSVFFYLDLGEAYAAQGNDEQATKFWRRGLDLAPRYPWDAEVKQKIDERLAALSDRR
jgi:tetratricopeptide (TPR) repeat protein